MQDDVDMAPLFRPLAIRGLATANRFVMAPMTRGFATGGVPGTDVAAYYRRRAENGVGLIVTEGVGVPHSAALGYSEVDLGELPEIDGEAALAGWRGVVNAVHAAGSRIAPQLWHQGPIRKHFSGRHATALSARPSGIWGPRGGMTTFSPDYLQAMAEPSEPLTDGQIVDIISAFARAAGNAARIGFDAIAIHGAHGYLIDSFLWDQTNLRTDRWSARQGLLAIEIVKAIRAEIGEDLPIIFRFSQWKQQDFKARLARTPGELEAILGPLADAGVDVFDASVRYFNRAEFAGSPLNLAGWAKKLTGKLSIAVGGVGMSKGMYDTLGGAGAASTNFGPLLARFLNGEFDLVGVGRALMNDATWVSKVRTGGPFLPYDDRCRFTLT